MIKEVELSRKIRKNSWEYWRENDYTYATYETWARNEYKINVLTSWTSFSSFSYSIEGHEKDVMFFLLRFS